MTLEERSIHDTVKDHLKNIFGKVGVRGRRALVRQLYLHTIFR